jgi:hypothetical protein
MPGHVVNSMHGRFAYASMAGLLLAGVLAQCRSSDPRRSAVDVLSTQHIVTEYLGTYDEPFTKKRDNGAVADLPTYKLAGRHPKSSSKLAGRRQSNCSEASELGMGTETPAHSVVAR